MPGKKRPKSIKGTYGFYEELLKASKFSGYSQRKITDVLKPIVVPAVKRHMHMLASLPIAASNTLKLIEREFALFTPPDLPQPRKRKRGHD